METINANVGSLSNFEVMMHLQKLKDSRKNQKGHLATITYETLKYLEGTPCGTHTPSDIKQCLKALEPFNLTKNEKLMIVNTPPASPLQIQFLIEESEERLTEEEVQQILQISAKYLGVELNAAEEKSE